MMEYSKYLGSNRSDEKYTPRYAVLPIIKYLSQKQGYGVRSIRSTANLYWH